MITRPGLGNEDSDDGEDHHQEKLVEEPPMVGVLGESLPLEGSLVELAFSPDVLIVILQRCGFGLQTSKTRMVPALLLFHLAVFRGIAFNLFDRVCKWS